MGVLGIQQRKGLACRVIRESAILPKLGLPSILYGCIHIVLIRGKVRCLLNSHLKVPGLDNPQELWGQHLFSQLDIVFGDFQAWGDAVHLWLPLAIGVENRAQLCKSLSRDVDSVIDYKTCHFLLTALTKNTGFLRMNTKTLILDNAVNLFKKSPNSLSTGARARKTKVVSIAAVLKTKRLC